MNDPIAAIVIIDNLVCFITTHGGISYFQYCAFSYRLTKEHLEAKKKMDDKSVEADKKTFLKAQIPKMEAEIKEVKEKLVSILESEELDPRGEYYILAEKLVK